MTEVDAGWYPDPAGGPTPRWWDGQDWTDTVQPMYAEEPQQVQPPTSSWPYHSPLISPTEQSD